MRSAGRQQTTTWLGFAFHKLVSISQSRGTKLWLVQITCARLVYISQCQTPIWHNHTAGPTWPGLPTNIDFNVNVIGRVIVVVYFIVMVIVIFICQLYLLLQSLGLAMEPATWTGTFTGLELTCVYLCVVND